MDMTLEHTPKEREILDLLQGADTWLDRVQIAELMGRKRLNPHDVETLEGLVTSKLVERDTEIVGITPKYLYRAIN